MYKVYLDKQLIHDLDSENNVLVNPTLNLELNKAATFEFSMECTHPFYDKLERFSSIIQVLCDGDEIFKGRIIEITDDMYKERTVYCESELAYLNDTIQRPAEYHLASNAVYEYLQAIIGSHNSQVGSETDYKNNPESVPKWLELGEISINDPNDYIYCYTNYNSTMEEIKEDLVDDLGGYIRIRNEYKNNDPLGTLTGRYIDYIGLEEYGRTSEQYIEFGENLLDFSNDIDQSDICTGIIPLGATLEESQYAAIDERVTIESVNSGSDYLTIPDAVSKYGLILKVVTWDDIETPSNLLTAGKNYLEEYDYEPQIIEATAVDMHLTDEEIESWRLGDKIFVESDPHDLHKRFPLASMTIPLDQPENTSVTLGTYEDTSLSARTNKTEAGLRNWEDFQIGNVIASAVAQASALIKARTNGYVTIHYDEDRDCADEILIMDTPSTDTATRVWRWNLNGLGYSSNGYEGDYGLAMTMDGRILGKFITASGMVLANDTEENFGKFDNTGMKIYKQAGNTDLLLMSVGQFGMMLYDESGEGLLASFDSEAVTFYSQALIHKNSATKTENISAKEGVTNEFNLDSGREIISVEATATLRSGHGEYTFDYGINADGNAYYTISNLSSEAISVYVSIAYFSRNPSSMKKNMQLDGEGLRVYDSSGNMRSNMDDNSFDVYDSSGTLRMTLDTYGLKYCQSDGATKCYISASGTTHYQNGLDVGLIRGSYMSDNENETGLSFDLEPEASYTGWAFRESTDASGYTLKLMYYSPNSSYTEGVNFGDRALLRNHRLYFGTSTSGAYVVGTTGGGANFHDGTFNFSSGSELRYGGYEVVTTRDIAGLSLLANGEEAEGDFSFYSGLQLDISELVNYKSSDETLKTSIQPINDARVDNITPVSFKWRDGDDRTHYGYIAQEVQRAVPEIVKENDDGLLSLAYTEIIPLLHAKINTLEDRIARLEELIYGKEESD